MKINADYESYAKVLSDYFNKGNRSIWLRSGLGGTVNYEINTYEHLIESLQDKRMFEGIPITLEPFHASNEKFEIIIHNDKEKLQLISQLQSIQFSEKNDKILLIEKIEAHAALEKTFSKISDLYLEQLQNTEVTDLNVIKEASMLYNSLSDSQKEDYLDSLATLLHYDFADEGMSYEEIEDFLFTVGETLSSPSYGNITINHNQNNQNLEIMETNIFESKKADLQVKIELPKQEKAFFDKMSTPNNLVNQIQKAGQKLEAKESLNVSINGTSFEIPKEKTEKGNILETVQSEYEKVQKANTTQKETSETKEQQQEESQQNQPSEEKKEKTNLGYLKEQILYLGFGEDPQMHKELAAKMGKPDKEFTINLTSDKASFKGNEINFTLNFKKEKDSQKTFLNTFTANLKNEDRKTDLTHTFTAKGDFTAKEAINLLEGRAVKTQIYNKFSDEREEAFVKLQLGKEKNEKGNFKMQVFNNNYGIDVPKIIDKAKLVFDNDKHREITQKSLEKGNIVSVKFEQDNKVTEGKAILNPQYKMLNLYDNKMKRVNSNEQAFQKDNSESKEVKNQQNYSRKM